MIKPIDLEKKKDVEYLQLIFEKLIYLDIIENKNNKYKEANVELEDIISFNIKVFIEYLKIDDEYSSFLNKKTKVKITSRFSLKYSNDNLGELEISSIYNNLKYLELIENNIVRKEIEEWHVYTFQYDQSISLLTVYDSEFWLTENLINN